MDTVGLNPTRSPASPGLAGSRDGQLTVPRHRRAGAARIIRIRPCRGTGIGQHLDAPVQGRREAIY